MKDTTITSQNQYDSCAAMGDLDLFAVNENGQVHLYNPNDDCVIVVPRPTWERAYGEYLDLMTAGDHACWIDFQEVIVCFTGKVSGSWSQAIPRLRDPARFQDTEVLHCTLIGLEVQGR